MLLASELLRATRALNDAPYKHMVLTSTASINPRACAPAIPRQNHKMARDFPKMSCMKYKGQLNSRRVLVRTSLVSSQ